ncbi:MAG: DUF937 domain-containing protein [Pseudomonadota bacterium]
MMAGMNLFDVLSQAQGGAALSQLGRQFGLERGQTADAVKALLPALSSGLKRNAAQPGGLEALLGAVQNGSHDQYLDRPEKLSDASTVDDGNAILGHLLGSKDVSRAAAARASESTGVSQDLLKKMLPLVAAMAMGSLSKQSKDPNIAQSLMGALGGGSSGGGGGLLGGIMKSVLGGGQTQASGSGGLDLGMLGGLLDADGDGNAMDDIFDMVTKR